MAVATAVGAIAASTVMQYQQGKKANELQKRAMEQSERNARDAASQADQAFNRANAKKPDIGAMIAGNEAAGRAGLSSTMLTGPTGVDPTALMLGRNTLLGG